MTVSTSTLPARFRYRLSPVNMRRGLWIVIGSLLILLALGFFASDSLGQTLLDDLRQQPAWALAMVAVGSVALALLIGRIVRMASQAWLMVDADGIRCAPHPHHGSRHWLRHEWQLPWSAVERAVIRRPGENAQHVQNWINTTLTLETSDGHYNLPLLLWDPAGEALDRPELTSFRPGKALHALTETHPLVAHLEQRNVEVVYRPLNWRGRWGMGRPDEQAAKAADGRGPVDLLAHPALVVMLSLMGALAVTAFLHFTVMPPIRALWSPDWGLIALVGSLVFAIAALGPGRAPARERTVVGLLLAVTVAGLWYPLSVRALSLFGDEPQTVSYIVDEPGRFVGLEPAYPAVDLRDLDIPEYWRTLRPGEAYSLELQRVGESRWVLRLGPLFDRTRAFFEER